MKRPSPYAVWVIAPNTEIGSQTADLAALDAFFTTGLAAEYRPTQPVTWVVGDAATDEAIFKALTAAKGRGRRLFWLIADTHDELGNYYLKTASKCHRLTIDGVWKQLIVAAKHDSSNPLIAILDTCHAGPPSGLPLNLVVFAACKPTETTQATYQGSIFTQAIIKRLTEGTAGQVAVGELQGWLAQTRWLQGQPVLIPGGHSGTTLNERAGGSVATPLSRYRTWLQANFAVLTDLFGNKLTEDVYIDLNLDPSDRSNLQLAGGNHRLGTLMAQPGTRWSVLGPPGAGKSTIARHLASDTAKDVSGAVPIYAPRSTWCRA